MAFDLYSGGMSRYFTNNWENTAQKLAKIKGIKYEMIYANGRPKLPEWGVIEDFVSQWIEGVNAGIKPHGSVVNKWNETSAGSYHTNRPGYSAYGALVIISSYIQAGKTIDVNSMLAADWQNDRIFLGELKPTPGQKFRQIICGSLFIPSDFMFSFDYMDVCQSNVHVCSNKALLMVLNELNSLTFKLTENEISSLVDTGYDDNANLGELAKYGMACFIDIAKFSCEKSYPIIYST